MERGGESEVWGGDYVESGSIFVGQLAGNYEGSAIGYGNYSSPAFFSYQPPLQSGSCHVRYPLHNDQLESYSSKYHDQKLNW